MILLDRLVCRTYWEQALKRRSVKIHRSLPACRQHHNRRAALRIVGMLWTVVVPPLATGEGLAEDASAGYAQA